MADYYNDLLLNQLIHHIRLHQNDEAKFMLDDDLIKLRLADELTNLLHSAVSCGNEVIVRRLIDLGCEVDFVHEPSGNTPLIVAVTTRDVATVKVLLEANANIDLANAKGRSALQIIFHPEYANTEIVQLIFNKLRTETVATDLLIDKIVTAGCDLFHCVVHLKDLRIIRCMLQRGFDVNSRNHCSRTVLHFATQQNDAILVKFLLDYGADVNALDIEGCSPLLVSASNGDKETMKLLLEAGADPNTNCNSLNLTAIILVLNNFRNVTTNDECFDLLLQYGAVVENPSKLLDVASKKNDSKKIIVLLNYLAMLEELGVPIADSDLHCEQEKLRSSIPLLMDLYRNFLKSKLFGNLTILDLLTDSDTEMKSHVKNDTLMLQLQQLLSDDEYKRSFPYYCGTLTKRISKAKRVLELEEMAIPIICEVMNGNRNQCYLVAQKVVGYLNGVDLERLSVAFHEDDLQ